MADGGQRYLRRFRRYRLRVLAALALSVVQAAMLLPIPLLIGRSIDRAIPNEDTAELVWLAVAMAGCAIVSVIAQIAAARH